MEPTILVVGEGGFCAFLKDWVQRLIPKAVVQGIEASQAQSWIQAHTPDILLVQQRAIAPGMLNQFLQGRSRWGFSYAIVLADEAWADETGTHQARTAQVWAHESGDHQPRPPIIPRGAVWEQAHMLSAGADAWLTLPLQHLQQQWVHAQYQLYQELVPVQMAAPGYNGAQVPLEIPGPPSITPAKVAPLPPLEIAPYDALLQAQLLAGWRLIQGYRDLLRTNDLLSTMALVDPLTELSNRRALDWDLPRHIQQARDRQEPLSLVIFDLDHFKRVNDTYGHLIGDVVLKLLSARLRHNLRFNDTLFRYGGEEFVAILSKTQAEEAIDIGQRLCRIVSGQTFTINDDLELALTISAGITELQTSDDSQGLSFLERADGHLRRAKQAGRNQVVFS